MQRYGNAFERIVDPHLFAYRIMGFQETLGSLVPQSLGDVEDQIVGGIGRHEPKRIEADRRRLNVDPGIGSGRYNRAAVRARALSHLPEDIIPDWNKPYW